MPILTSHCPSSYSTSSRITEWLANLSPRDTKRLKRSRSESPPSQRKHRILTPSTSTSVFELGTVDMAQAPKTPTGSAAAGAKRQRRTTLSEQEDLNIMDSSQPALPSPSPTSAKNKSQTKNTRNHRNALEEHMMYLDMPSAEGRNPEFLQQVREILKGDRCSEKSERSVHEIKKEQHTNRVAMENTYLAAVLPQMIGKSRTVKIKDNPLTPESSTSGIDPIIATSSNPSVIQQMKMVVRSFAEDRLHWEGPCYFVRELITGPRTVIEFGITDPQPDICFGIRKQEVVFNAPKVSNSTQNHIHAAGALNFCFFIIEDKGPDGPFAHAVTQAIRGGATLVRVMRELRRRAGYPPSGFGADEETFVFTCAWEHGYADIYVSWQEVLPEGEITHMTWLDSYALRKDQDIKEFCRDLHNILDWGIAPERIINLEQMVVDISKREAAGLF
ncbi:MAG: hypothetical protein Q9170_005982 [Blastenia crenularia]